MEWPDVQRRIAGGEDARTEFKHRLGDLRRVGRTVCAFANGDGGLVVIGVDDAGAVVGDEENPETVQERLLSFLQTGCGKARDRGVRQARVRGRVGALDRRAPPSARIRAVLLRRRVLDQTRWEHGGAVSSELEELLNAFGLVLTERQIIPSATVDDIDFGAVRAFMRAQGLDPDEAPQRAREDDLRNGSIVDELDGVARPTLYGLMVFMVFGRDPQAYAHTLSLFVECTAYGGTDQSGEVLSAGEGKGRLQDQVQRAMGWFRSLGRRETYEGIRRIDVPPAPEAALREALVNAVIHRDYAITGSQVLLEVFDDRIVVTSPGALPNHMTVDQARKGGAPRSRNEMMANAMVVGGLMERRGRGWLTMRHAMRRFNGTEPELVSDERNRFVRVTFERGPRNA